MRKSILIFAALALTASFSLSSCQKEQGPANPDEGLKSIALSLNFGQAGTKATIDEDQDLEDPWETNYKEFKTLDLYFTNASDEIVYYYRASDTDAEGNGQTIWNSLYPESGSNSNSGVRFIGMEGISKVYVVANGPEISGLKAATEANGTVTGSYNITDLNALIKLINYGGAQNTMIYAGATTSLILAGSSVTEDVGTILVGAEGGSDYLADITIRPALSRLEVSKVGVKTQGEAFFKTDENGQIVKAEEAEAIYKVEYSNFKPTLVGAYASNVYRTAPLFPIQTTPDAGDIFATPTFQAQVSPITEGKWTSIASETELNNQLCYANYDAASDSYGALVSEDYSAGAASGNNWLLFDGTIGGNKVIPFNFFVPYDITSDAEAGAITALDGSVFPTLHFQFKKQADNMTLNCYKKVNSVWESLSAGDELETVQSLLKWPAAYGSEQDIAFANVVKYYESDPATGAATEVTLRPGYIYRVMQVIADPTNITVSTKNTEEYNVYVVVTVVPFTAKDVYPGFEQ